MMNYLIESSICITLFYGLYHLVFRDATAHYANRLYLLTSLIISVLIPTLSLPLFKNQIIYSYSPSLPVGYVKFLPDEAVPFDWSILWFGIYITGVVISFLVFFIGIFKILRIIQKGESANYRGHSIIYTATDITLCSFGKFIIVPLDKKENLTEYELTHEINHITNLHTMDILFVKIFRCLFWFNPIVFMYERRLVEVHEYQADEATLNHFGKKSYLSFIIDQVSIKSKHSLVHNFNSLIKKRLIMMSSESRSGNAQYLAILPVLLVVLSLFSFDTYDEYIDTNGKMITILNDTIPDGVVLDTIYMFDFNSMKQVSRVVAKPVGANAYLLPGTDSITIAMSGVDTISTIDYDTYMETVVSINYNTGVIDTLINE